VREAAEQEKGGQNRRSALCGKDRLIAALDVDDLGRYKELVRTLSGAVGGFKVGMRLYYRVGPEALAFLRGMAPVIFADLKLHDIPSTVGGGVRALVAHGATLINVHAAGGKDMMRAAREAAAAEADRLGVTPPKLVAVTVLTSLDEEALANQIGIREPLQARVIAWARMAQECGLDGVVASSLEAAAIRKACGPGFVIITPGIRMPGSHAGDQRRVATPAHAVREGADYIVVGRPVVEAEDPARAVKEIVDSLE
jgi:orotidine-5'-phosphate decarboxylase